MERYKILKKSDTHTLVKGPMGYYLYIPNESFKEDDRLLDNYWTCDMFIVDVDRILTAIMK